MKHKFIYNYIKSDNYLNTRMAFIRSRRPQCPSPRLKQYCGILSCHRCMHCKPFIDKTPLRDPITLFVCKQTKALSNGRL